MYSRITRTVLMPLIGLLLFGAGIVVAQTPSSGFTYQGELTDADGTPGRDVVRSAWYVETLTLRTTHYALRIGRILQFQGNKLL